MRAITADYVALNSRPPSIPSLLYFYFKHPGFKAAVRYRIANRLAEIEFSKVSWLIYARTVRLTGADINPYAIIGDGLVIHHPVGIVIGAGARVGRFSTLLQGVTLGEAYSQTSPGYPMLGDHVVIGAGAKLLGGISVGDYAVVGANSVVLSDVPAGATAVGIPARLIKVPNGREPISPKPLTLS